MSQQQLNDVRSRIADTKSERTIVAAQRRSRKDAVSQLESTVAHWGTLANQIGAVNSARSVVGDATSFLTVNARAIGPQGPLMVAIDLGPIAVLLLGAPAVREALAQHLASVPEGLTPAGRKKKLTALDATLHKMQYEEEGLIRTLEASGEAVAYRKDADPFYTLTWRHEA